MHSVKKIVTLVVNHLDWMHFPLVGGQFTNRWAIYKLANFAPALSTSLFSNCWTKCSLLRLMLIDEKSCELSLKWQLLEKNANMYEAALKGTSACIWMPTMASLENLKVYDTSWYMIFQSCSMSVNHITLENFPSVISQNYKFSFTFLCRRKSQSTKWWHNERVTYSMGNRFRRDSLNLHLVSLDHAQIL